VRHCNQTFRPNRVRARRAGHHNPPTWLDSTVGAVGFLRAGRAARSAHPYPVVLPRATRHDRRGCTNATSAASPQLCFATAARRESERCTPFGRLSGMLVGFRRHMSAAGGGTWQSRSAGFSRPVAGTGIWGTQQAYLSGQEMQMPFPHTKYRKIVEPGAIRSYLI
jgi:hypothetical protein